MIITFWCVASASGTVSCDLWHDYRDCIERSDSNNCVGLLVELINLSDASRDDSRWHFVRCHGCDLQKAPIFEVCDEDLVLTAMPKCAHDVVSIMIFSPNEWTKSCNRLATRCFILSPIWTKSNTFQNTSKIVISCAMRCYFKLLASENVIVMRFMGLIHLLIFQKVLAFSGAAHLEPQPLHLTSTGSNVRYVQCSMI